VGWAKEDRRGGERGRGEGFSGWTLHELRSYVNCPTSTTTTNIPLSSTNHHFHPFDTSQQADPAMPERAGYTLSVFAIDVSPSMGDAKADGPNGKKSKLSLVKEYVARKCEPKVS